MPRILIVDDEPVLCKSLSRSLSKAGYEVFVATTAEAGVHCVIEQRPDLVLLDLKFRGKDGLEALREIKAFDPSILVIIITAYGSVETAVEAMKLGAADFLCKPLDLRVVHLTVARALEGRRMHHRLLYYHRRDFERAEGLELIGQSPAIRHIREVVDRIARIDPGSAADLPTVLILGETGTGKDLVARLIHWKSPLAHEPFVEVDCASLPKHLIEAELFGYERGAFTDAKASKPGLVEVADGGTLFLNEVSEIPLEAQAKLLTLIEKKWVRRIGDVRERPVNVRILAATNRDLEEAVRIGAFRRDLLYRLKVLTIELPPLRARGEDVLLLAEYFLERYVQKYKTPPKRLSPAAREALRQYTWPGNVRELMHVVERAVLMADGPVIDAGLLGLSPPSASAGTPDFPGVPDGDLNLFRMEQQLIRTALTLTQGNVSAAARKLGVTRGTLRYRMRKYGIQPTPQDG